MTNRIAGWIALVVAMSTLNYAVLLSGSGPPEDVFYRYGTALGAAIQYGFILGLVLVIVYGRRDLLALRRPHSWVTASLQMFGVLLLVYAVAAALSPFLDPGEEQGLTPDEWDGSRAGAYAANAVVVVLGAPLVEELLFRGAGFSLLRPLGALPAVLIIGLAFAATHGLLEAFPILFAFGAGLAWLRERTGSVYPGMVLHAVFNAAALVLAVST